MRELPALRRELSFLPAPPSDDGTPRWFLFDPVRNSFHVMTRRAVNILSHWKAETPDAAITRMASDHPDLAVDKETLKTITAFLYRQNLTQAPPAGRVDVFAQQEGMTRPTLNAQLMYKSVFFRIPLYNPHKFLSTTAPYLNVLFKKQSWAFILTIGLIGLVFAVRQWEQFLATFMYFFTLEGFFFYALTLTLIKILHELGHAYTAHHYGAHVSVMGIAFLLMFPVLYTDTTDAWRITSRRKRALIDAGGIIVEFAIACIAIFLWSFLPDGPARSTAFFAATSSWLLSLMVNLNPCMRFDGYYLLSDLCGFQNMQSSGFQLGRWKMRQNLWGLTQPKPIKTTPRKQFGLLTYCYATWTYRLFLFTLIALLVHHFSPKPFGAVFFIGILILFLGAPIKRELIFLWSQHMAILSNRRGRYVLALCGFSLVLFFWPWQTQVSAPALLQPAMQTEVFPLSAAHIDNIHIQNGDIVSKGDLLMSLSSKALEFERDQSRQRLKLLTAQLDRQASNLTERRLGATLLQEFAAEDMKLGALEKDIDRLNIYAPQEGIVTDLSPYLHIGRYIRKSDPLMRIVSPRAQSLLAFPNDIEATRLSRTSPFVFISDDAAAKPVKGYLTHLAPTSEPVITDTILTSIAGGKIAVIPNDKGDQITHRPVFKVQGQANDTAHLSRAQRGIVKIDAKPQSPARALWRSIIRVLIRETDF